MMTASFPKVNTMLKLAILIKREVGDHGRRCEYRVTHQVGENLWLTLI